MDKANSLYPYFQRYIEKEYGLSQATSKDWAHIISEHTESPQEATKEFYRHLHNYYEIYCKNADN